ncbi:protein kinase [Streptomyces sp. NPDC059786]|uniref:protein kinase domain-containing protein n=1 Tax=Streptomyces sp. NPDC059786 TaxID=3346946 RepID=UPI003652292D
MYPLTASDPDRIGRYRLTGRLGAGGMGTVYLGSTPGGRAAAIKVIGDRFQYEEQALERFRREVTTLHTVRSAYTASLIDCGLDAPPYWFATEYVPGRTLDAAVRANGALPAGLCRSVMAALAEGLSDIHVHGIQHRDVKPQNIILSPVGPQLIDFGIAKDDGQAALTQIGHTAGTPGFTPPEAIQGEKTTVAADVFALGATMAFAATGRPPYGTGAASAVAYRTVHGDIDLEGVESELAGMIAACTDRDPARRPAPEAIVEFCQSQTALANDADYRRIATPDASEGGPAPAPVPTTPAAGQPTAVDPSGAAPTAVAPPVATPTAVDPAALGARPTDILPASGPSLSAGGPGQRTSRRRIMLLAAVGVVVAVVAAGLLVVVSGRDTEKSAGPEASPSPTATGATKEPDEGGTGDSSEDPADKISDDGSDDGSDGGEDAVPEEKVIDEPMSLHPGEEIVAARIKLVLQRDGNLVAYDETNQARWSSQTQGAGARADFQEDGNLVVYNAEDQAVWASRTDGHEQAVLTLQKDGNITISDGTSVLWATGTNY